MSVYGAMKAELMAELEARLPFLIAEEVAREFDRREKAQKLVITGARMDSVTVAGGPSLSDVKTTTRTKRGSAKVEETPPDDEPMTDF